MVEGRVIIDGKDLEYTAKELTNISSWGRYFVFHLQLSFKPRPGKTPN